MVPVEEGETDQEETRIRLPWASVPRGWSRVGSRDAEEHAARRIEAGRGTSRFLIPLKVMPKTARPIDAGQLRSRRVLTLWNLPFTALSLSSPAPISLLGVTQKLSNGHTLTTILVAMLGIAETGISYKDSPSREGLADGTKLIN